MKIVFATDLGHTTDKFPPLGLLYLASYNELFRKDRVVVVDAYSQGMSRESFVEELEREQPDIIAMSSFTHTFLDQMDTLLEVRKRLPDSRIVLGGHQAAHCWSEILAQFDVVDYIIRGDGERAFHLLVESLCKGEEPGHAPGVCYRKQGKPVANGVDFVRDLDELPFPDRSLIRDNEYGITWEGAKFSFGDITTIQTSRGCPFSCNFCTSTAFFRCSWRARSARSVVDELEEIHSLGYKNCVIVDYNFTVSEERVTRICEELIERKVKLHLACEGRADRAPLGLLKKMKKAGFDTMFFGGDSGNQKVLDYYHKTLSPSDTRKAVQNAKKAGLNVFLSFILGAPNETKRDMMKTLQFASSLRPHALLLPVLEVLQGTPLWEEFEREGKIGADDWKKNHFIFEFREDMSEDDFLELVQVGYQRYFQAWKSIGGFKELLESFLRNSYSRELILGNLFAGNPLAWRAVKALFTVHGKEDPSEPLYITNLPQ